MKKLLTLLFLLLSTNGNADDGQELLSLISVSQEPSKAPRLDIPLTWQSSWKRDTAPKNQPNCHSYCETIRTYSQAFNLPESWIWAVIKAESNFDPKAVSPKGAKGLMQLMDINSRHYGVDPFNPKENIRGGSELLATLYTKYQDLSLSLAAYNAGMTAVDKYKNIPPFPETQTYVNTVLHHIQQYELTQKELSQ